MIALAQAGQVNNVLVEYFTNTGCDFCSSDTKILNQALMNGDSSFYDVICYHNVDSNANDPFYEDDTTVLNARSNYYGVQSDPALFLNSVSAGDSSSTWSMKIQNAVKNPNYLNIEISGGGIVNKNGVININLSAISPVASHGKIFAVLTETGVKYHGANGDTVFNNIFRSSLSTWAGVPYSSNTIQLPFTLGYDHKVNPPDSVPWNLDSCRIIVWAQDTITKNIYGVNHIWLRNLPPYKPLQLALSDSIISAPPDGGEYTAEGLIVNSQQIDTFPVNILAVRVVNNLPPNWFDSMCINDCAAPTIDTIRVDGIEWGGGHKIFFLHFETDTIPDSSNVKIYFINSEIPPDTIVQNFYFRTNDSTQFTFPHRGQIISPNNPDTIRWETNLNEQVTLTYTTDDSNFVQITQLGFNISAKTFIWTPGFSSNYIRLRISTSKGIIESAAFSTQTTIVNENDASPFQLFLSQNYPNPFSSTTTISYSLPAPEPVTLRVYNSLGEEVATLANGREDAGNHSVVFRSDDLQSGMYFYRLTAGKDVQSGMMAVVR